MSIALVWFRQDLRSIDNPALSAACANHTQVIPLFIADQHIAQLGGAQRWWLHHSLDALDKSLQEHGLILCLRRGDALEHLSQLINEHKIDEVYWNRCYELETIKRDRHIKTVLQQQEIMVHSSNGYLLNEPWTIKNKSGEYFKVFTPYWKHCLRQITIPAPHLISKQLTSPKIKSDNLADWQLLPTKPNWAKGFSKHWQPGELGAKNKLKLFLKEHLEDYSKARDFPAQDATSKLSPHLHFGEISPWHIWRVIADFKQDPACNLRTADRFLWELGWREFSYHLLYHYPSLPKNNFRQEFDHFTWEKNDQHLHAWQQGLTGYPIVDAGMRELWQTGYMHNRVRMIVASFLCKDLLIDWRKGAEWFMDTLFDADLASNSLNWQWVAGSGVDAAPYFRIFNPVLQGEKFDATGDYVRKWLPELSKVSNKWLHKPWAAPAEQLDIILGKDYPYPIVDHAEARKLALEIYHHLKKSNNADSR